VALAGVPAQAEPLPVPDVLLAMVDELSVVVHDQVTDGCWADPAGAREAVAFALGSDGFRIAGETPDSTYVSLRAVGYETRDATGVPIGCAVYYKLVASRPLQADVPRSPEDAVVVEHPFWERGSLLVGPKNLVQQALRDGFVRLSTALADAIYEARIAVFAGRPDLQAKLGR
jgi:hypothetical protein